LLDAIFAAWAVMAVVRLFRAGESNDEDFRVYFRAALLQWWADFLDTKRGGKVVAIGRKAGA
jgi:hypothetical protein